MKRKLMLLAILSLVGAGFMTIGCGGDEQSDQPQKKPKPAKRARRVKKPVKKKPAPKTKTKTKPAPAKPKIRPVRPKPKPKTRPVRPKPKPKTRPAPPAPKPAPKTKPKPPDPSEGKARGRWADAKVGTLVKSRTSGNIEITQEVVRADETTVTVKISNTLPGQKPVERVEQRFFDPAVHEGMMKALGEKVEPATITVAGKPRKCEVYQTQVKLDGKIRVTRTYLCRDVPGWLVRMEGNATGEMKLISEVVEISK